MIFKYFLDVGQDEQKRRIKRRKTDPLRMWKLSPIDSKSLDLWDEYTSVFEKMFSRTHTPFAPWIIVNSNDKKAARLNIARDLLSKIDYEWQGSFGCVYAPRSCDLAPILSISTGIASLDQKWILA